MTREEKIDRLVELEAESMSDDLDGMVEFIRGALREGHKGFDDYTDEELDQALAEMDGGLTNG